MRHLLDLELSGLHDQTLTGREKQQAEDHLRQCEACREALAEIENLERSLAPLYRHDPGEEYFEGFADRVEARIRALGHGERSAARGLGGLWGWLRSPRGLAWSGAAAAVVVGAGIVMIATRESRIPDLRSPAMVERSNQVAEPGGAPPRGADPAVRPEEAPQAPGSVQQGPGSETPSPPAGRGSAGEGAARTEAAVPAPAVEEKPGSGISGAGPVHETVGPGRLMKVRRDERGEDIPEDPGLPFAKSPPAPAPPPGDGPRIVKPKAQPLDVASPLAPRERETPATGKPAQTLKGVKQTLSEDRNKQDLGEKPPLSSGSGAASSPLDAVTLERDAAAPAGKLCGNIVDPSGRPVQGARVAIADLGLTTSSGRDGRYCIDVPAGEHTLSVMAVGFEALRRTVQVRGSAEENVTLQAVSVLEGPGVGRGLRDTEGAGRRPRPREPHPWPTSAADLARKAELKIQRAEESGSAPLFDQAAEAWGLVLEKTKDGPSEIETRARVAEARYRAWEIEATPKRTQAAVEALTSYLVRAPLGPERAEAARRLDRVKR